jgi:hypothetical protein
MMRRKKRDINPGALLKAVLRSGEGTKRPSEGDQVIFLQGSGYCENYHKGLWFL